MIITTPALFIKTAIVSAVFFCLLLLVSNGVVEAIPKGFMTFFDGATCPPQWTEYESSQGRIIISVTDAANAGITVGVPLGDQEDRTHTHRTILSGNLPYQHIAGAGGSNTQGAKHGQVSTTFISDPSPSGLPFTQLILCRIQTQYADANPVAMGTFGFFDPSVDSCPQINVTKSAKNVKQGTSWIPATSVNGRALVPSYDNGGGSANQQRPYSSGEVREHNHTGNVVMVPETKVDYIGVDGCCNDGPSQYSPQLQLSGNSDSASSNIPYVQLLTCQSTDYTFDLTLPAGALIFTEGKCPPGWTTDLELAGRFLVSLPANGQPGAYFGGKSLSPTGVAKDPLHNHGLNATVNFPSVGIELGSGCCGGPYPSSGTFPFAGTSTEGDVEVPYTMFPLCRQLSDRSNEGAKAKSVVKDQALLYRIKSNNKNKKH